MVLEKEYKEDILELVRGLSDGIFVMCGYDKDFILNDQDVVYQLWISYQKNMVDYGLDTQQAFSCTLKDVLGISLISTKDEERKALEKITHILESLGEGSYCANAFKGCVELAERNIEEDVSFSFPDRLQKKDYKISEQLSQIKIMEKRISDMKKRLDKSLQEIERLENWLPYEIPENYTQKAYEELAESGVARQMTDSEAVDMVSTICGFDAQSIRIIRTVSKLEKSNNGKIRKVGTYIRNPLYASSDWNYIRFDCRGFEYEYVCGTLRVFD